MNRSQISLAIASLVLVSSSYAAADVQTDAAKKAAVEACTIAATEKYGVAEVASKARKKKVGRTSGYGIKLNVGSKKKAVSCIASSDGTVTFFNGSI